MRQTTGVPGLDQHLGGGLLPGALTVVVGATGIGKTQLGVQYAQAGLAAEQHRGVVFDMAARGDSQSHAPYAERICDWKMRPAESSQQPNLETFFENPRAGDYFHVFDYRGQRVTRRDLEHEEWRAWQAELNYKLKASIGFLYGAFVSGCRRVVIDGVEPTDRPGESIQFQLIEYIYHQVLRKDPEWVARDLFREKYRANAEKIAQQLYDPKQVGCLLMATAHETLLDDLIARGLSEGDALSNANTLIYMGKIRRGDRFVRGLYIAKHRGSACTDAVLEYTINDQGLVMNS
ncbi:RAD55 family ATPase [Lignipirellula cremea]|uniref:Circadian clock protein KaiC n=1 Tax=Lignipirellula cremea TaxID=2528010 RepID=A0A518E3T7_9BACT|nr:ATPase domain-containing protein [Lignipirellula cremea]QDU98759.1 circadian clock protein KaiC [Lignipirellula cremea]